MSYFLERLEVYEFAVSDTGVINLSSRPEISNLSSDAGHACVGAACQNISSAYDSGLFAS